MKKTTLIIVVTALCLVIAGLNPAMAAKKFPKKPITIICPWSAGGGTDRTARFISEKLSGILGVPVNVVNKTGGGGAVGRGHVEPSLHGVYCQHLPQADEPQVLHRELTQRPQAEHGRRLAHRLLCTPHARLRDHRQP